MILWQNDADLSADFFLWHLLKAEYDHDHDHDHDHDWFGQSWRPF